MSTPSADDGPGERADEADLDLVGSGRGGRAQRGAGDRDGGGAKGKAGGHRCWPFEAQAALRGMTNDSVATRVDVVILSEAGDDSAVSEGPC